MRTLSRIGALGLAAAFMAVASGCDVSAPITPARVDVPLPEGFEPLPVPQQNPLRPERVALGERLFFDPLLSRDQTISCGTCHLPELAFSDGETKSTGVEGRLGLRNSPSLLNVAYRPLLFWDGGALFLEGQALVPLEDEREMDVSIDTVLARLRADASYTHQFEEAFDGEGPTIQTFTYALAAFQRTIVSAPTRFDAHRAGDTSALTATEQHGLELFDVHCQACHAGPLLTSNGYQNNGVTVTDDDPGRERITHDVADRGRFRVPSLRGVAGTAPYFHDGRFATLDDVVDHYDRGGDGTPGQSTEVRPLRLTEAERSALVAFLKTLDDQPAPIDRTIP
ncbi:MAG: cytochrome-c peroxidase [Rubricoccaceae bacterium]